MIKIEIHDYKFFMDGYLKDNLDVIKNEAIPNNWDCLIIVHGKEGTGKSTIGTQAALYLCHNYDIDYTCWLPEEFERIVEEAKPESSILWDEAITGANATAWANSVSQSVISKLTQIRKKRLKIFICFPYLNMLNKYFISRCVGSIYVYSKGFKDRGHAFFYNQPQTEYLYSLMKERYRLQPSKAYNIADKSFYFTFTKTFCLPENIYDTRKERARTSSKNEKSDLIQKKQITTYCIDELNGSTEIVANIFNRSKRQIRNWLSEGRKQTIYNPVD